MRKTWIVLAVIGAGAAFATAGCGGDDDDTTTAALSKQEFIAQGDEICAKADKELDQASRETFDQGKPSQQEVEQFATDSLVPNIQGQIDAIRALGIPEGDEEQINATLDDAQEAVDRLAQDPSQLEDGPAGRQLQAAGDELQQYGFKKCGG
jgi:hypothetical protein